MRPLLIFIFIVVGSFSGQAQELILENVEACIQHAKKITCCSSRPTIKQSKNSLLKYW